MKNFKKAIALCLMFLLILSLSVSAMAASASINKKAITLNVKKTAQLKINNVAAKTKVKWSSSKKSVVTVSSSGKITAKKKGTANITAKVGKQKFTCKVTVKQPVTSVKLNKSSIALKKSGETFTLKATVKPGNANNKGLKWISSNAKVATVNSKGVVKAVGNGEAKISATTVDGSKKNVTCKVKVSGCKEIQPTSVKLSKTQVTFYGVKQNVSLTATVSPANAVNKTITWSTGNKSVATVSNGKITSVGYGDTTITAKTTNGKTATCKVSVKKATTPVSSQTQAGKKAVKLEASCKLAEITDGQSVTGSNFIVKEVYSDGTKKEISAYKVSGKYSSSDGKWYFTISSGSLTTTIPVKAAVKKPAVTKKVTGIEVSCSKTEVEEGYKFALSDFTVKQIFDDGSKSSAPNYSIEVSYKDGYNYITVSCGDFKKELKVKVNIKETEKVPTVQSIKYSMSPASVYVNEDIAPGQIKVEAVYTDGKVENVTDFTTDFTPKTSAGEYNFTIKWKEFTKTARITVKEKEAPKVTLVEIQANYNKNKIFSDESPSKGDMSVTGIYSDGHSEPISDFSLSYVPAAQHKGTAVLIVGYEDKSLNISVPYYVRTEPETVDIEVSKTSLKVGESFPQDGVVVYATDFAGSRQAVSGYQVRYTPKDTPGKATVYVDYKGFSLDFDIDVIE